MVERFRRRFPKRAALLSVPLLGVIAGATLFVAGSGGATGLPDRLSPAQLDCPIHGPLAEQGTGDVVIDQQVFDDVLPYPAGNGAQATIPDAAGRKSPEAALQDYVTIVKKRYPGLSASSFSKIGEESDTADFKLVEDGRVVQVVRMRRVHGASNGWAPLAMFGCGS